MKLPADRKFTRELLFPFTFPPLLRPLLTIDFEDHTEFKMAHKELISKYAKQLSESQQRILELEITIADARTEAEEVKTSGRETQSDGKDEIAALRAELMSKNEKIAALDTHVQELQLQTQKSNYKTTDKSEELLKQARARISSLEKDLDQRGSKLEHQAENLKKQLNELQTSLREGSKRQEGLRAALVVSNAKVELGIKRLQKAQEQVVRLREDLTARDKALSSAEAKLLTADRTLGRAATKAKATAASNRDLTAEIERLKDEIKSLDRKHANDVNRDIVAAKHEVAELKSQLGREKKRR